jgi:Ca-activated chloride channel homolog
MTEPRLEILPIRPAAKANESTTLDVLVRISPPTPEVHVLRPPINLGLVLDHSGSMAVGKKMEFAREAAVFAVRQLLPADRVSVTIFDEIVETIVPNTAAVEKESIVRKIEQVQPDGSTALHGGWAEGARQVAGNRIPEGLNRVLILSDGLANVGLTDPAVIAGEARGMVSRGVGTTTLGVGDDYHEDLMQAMAQAGDGNYYYIETPRQLSDIFQTELQGLMATLGQKVSLGLEPRNGVEVLDVFNDFEAMENGRRKLPNLVAGMPLSVVVRLRVPPLPGAEELCRVRLAWDEPRAEGRRSLRETLVLPSVDPAAWEALPEHAEVREQAALLMAARAKKEAIRALDRGDLAQTHAMVAASRDWAMSVPASASTLEELDALKLIEDDLKTGSLSKFRKKAGYQLWSRQRGKPTS